MSKHDAFIQQTLKNEDKIQRESILQGWQGFEEAFLKLMFKSWRSPPEPWIFTINNIIPSIQ